MTSADCYFAAGRAHAVCQDYALASADAAAPWVALSDGCSSSPHTDVGARLWALAAGAELARGRFEVEAVLARARAGLEALPLPAACLDATLLVAWRQGDVLRARIFGDGLIAARRRDTGALELHAVRFERSAPLYLSYALGPPERLVAYLQQTDGARRTVTTRRREAGAWGASEVAHRDGAAPHTVDLPVARYDLVALFSDGAESFRRPRGTAYAPVPVTEVIDHLLAIKSTRGRFITRRARAFLTRHCSKHRWRHEDDLAAAGLFLGEAA